MRRILPCLLFAGSVATAQAQAPTAQPASTATKTPSVDATLTAIRADLQSARADIMAKNMTLTAEQAAKFWPLFDKYQKEQNVMMDAQLKGIQKYVDSYDKLDDAAALGLMKAHLDRDAQMTALRQKWLGEFQ
jgi:hypothetical protein